MKKQIIITFVLLLIQFGCIAQNPDCNQKVWIGKFAKLISKDICIKNGPYHISQVYEMCDVNNDGLKDLIVDYNKVNLKDGDTIFVSVYIQKSDSTFKLLKTFDNLYPIYFDRYDLEYQPSDEKLDYMQKRYEGQYPLKNINIENDKIIITSKVDATTDLIVTYKFKLNNWVYEKAEVFDFFQNKTEVYDLKNTLGPTIDNFTYFIEW